MARGDSGRIVIEIDPEKKQKLYEVLDSERTTLKSWFLERVDSYLEEQLQPSMFPSTNDEGGSNESTK